jgi:hypothetical protein
MIRSYFERHRPLAARPPLLTGHDLIHTFGLEPSPIFKSILIRLEEKRLAGTLHSKSEAERWVADFLSKRKG